MVIKLLTNKTLLVTLNHIFFHSKDFSSKSKKSDSEYIKYINFTYCCLVKNQFFLHSPWLRGIHNPRISKTMDFEHYSTLKDVLNSAVGFQKF